MDNKKEFTASFTISNEGKCQKCPLLGAKKATKQIRKVESSSVESITPVCDEHAQVDLYERFMGVTVEDYKPW